MFRRMLASVLLGVLVVGAVVVGYGSFDKGFATTMSSLFGGEGHDGDRRDRHRDRDDDHD